MSDVLLSANTLHRMSSKANRALAEVLLRGATIMKHRHERRLVSWRR
jgi:hypothetical protein